MEYGIYEDIQWQSQEFPRGGGANSPGGAKIQFCQKFPKYCMKSKEFGPQGTWIPCVPLRSTTDIVKTEELMAELKRIEENAKEQTKQRNIKFDHFQLEQFSDFTES